MQVSVSQTGSLERRIEVAVPATEIAQEVEDRLKKMSRTARLKGFRPGKVPFSVLRAQYGDAVRAEVVNDKMRSSLGQALDERKLRPAAGTRIEPIATDPDQDLKFAAVFDILPEIKLKPMAELNIERLKVEVTDADVEAMIASMRQQRVQYKEYAGGARLKDRVLIDYEGRIGDESFEGGTAQDAEVILGAGQSAPELDEGLKGATAGEQRDLTLNFPDTHPNKAVAGKTAQLKVSIKRVDEPVLPEVDEEFCREYGVEEGGIDGLRREVRTSMEHELQTLIKSRLRVQVLDTLYRENPLEVPRSMLEREMQALQIDHGRRSGIKDPAQLQPIEAFREVAQHRTAVNLILRHIVESEGLRPEPQRIEQQLTDEAARFQDPDSARTAIKNSREMMEQIFSIVLEGQVVDWVLERATIKDVPRTFSEATGFGRDVRQDDNAEKSS